MRSTRFPLLLLLASFAFLPLRAGAETLRINTNDVFPRSSPDGRGFEDRIVAEGLRRLGHSLAIVRLPSERALVSLQRGEVDGDYVRISGLDASYPGIVLVPEPIASMDFCAFAPSGAAARPSWESLAGIRVGHITGWKIVEERLKGHPAVTSVRDEKSLFELLLAGRVDAVVYERLEGSRYLAAAGLGSKAVASPTLERRDMFLYLRPGREALAAELGRSLAAMRAEGLTARIVAEVLESAGMR